MLIIQKHSKNSNASQKNGFSNSNPISKDSDRF
jgi:hypothetical protein